jgi:hypothetical protein
MTEEQRAILEDVLVERGVLEREHMDDVQIDWAKEEHQDTLVDLLADALRHVPSVGELQHSVWHAICSLEKDLSHDQFTMVLGCFYDHVEPITYLHELRSEESLERWRELTGEEAWIPPWIPPGTKLVPDES